MIKFKLSVPEIIEILDPLNQNAYDKLQGALEQKILNLISEKKWLEIWESGDWEIELSLNFDSSKLI